VSSLDLLVSFGLKITFKSFQKIYVNFQGDKITRICSVADAYCFNKAEHLMRPETAETNEFEESEESRRIINECNCLPNCKSIEYEQEVFITKLKPGKEKYENEWEQTEYDGALRFYFGADEYTALKRHASYGVVNFLSNCGGLLGLFIGVSALSVVEVFYFFVIRLTSDFVRKLKRNVKVEVISINEIAK
jgi:acid-sensing ion channel, other